MSEKVCGVCGKSEWYPSGPCRPCAIGRWHSRTPEERAAAAVRAKAMDVFRWSGVSPEEQAALMASQGGRCAACGDLLVPGGKTVLDHCHKTLAIRGFLCHPCNLAEGFLRSSPERARKLADYLERPPAIPRSATRPVARRKLVGGARTRA